MSIHRQIDFFALFLIALLGLSLFQLLGSEEREPEVAPTRGDVQSYQAGVADYFRVPLSEVRGTAAHVDPLELPVVFLLARYGAVGAEEVLDLRSQGLSWQDAAHQIRLGPEIFYHPLAGPPDRAFGSAYRQFHEHPRSEWSRIRLDDAEIVALVNLRFLAEQSGERPASVAELHAQGHDFVSIFDHLQRHTLRAETAEEPGSDVPG